MTSETVAVLGAGAWGTALATMLAKNGRDVVLWGRDRQALERIAAAGRNEAYLPGIDLASGLKLEHDLDTTLTAARTVLLVTPAQSVGEMARRFAAVLDPAVPVILCAKGIDRTTGKLPATMFRDACPDNPVGALSGPSFATDVARGLPTAVTLGAGDMGIARDLARLVSTPAFRVYASDDLTGVELGGALKNVIALAIGVCRGMGLGASAEAALVARGFAELSRLSVRLGARAETLMGLSGLGDLVLTCSSTQSRNFSYGIALGRMEPTAGLPLAEGALTAPVALELARRNGVECPVIGTVAALVSGTMTPRMAVEALLNRPLKNETD